MDQQPNQNPSEPPVTPNNTTIENSSTNTSANQTDVLGIISLICAFIGMQFIGFILGLVGSSKAKKEGRSNTLSKIGWILNLVFGIITAILVILWFVFAVNLSNKSSEIRSETDSITKQIESQESNTPVSTDFNKGETANFGDYSVKINNVSRGYVPANSYTRAKDGNEFIVLDLTVTNTSDRSQYVSNFDFDIEIDGLLDRPSYAKPPGTELRNGTLLQDKSVSGQIVFEVPSNKQGLKLAKKGYTYDKQSYESKEVVYKLAF
jgi:preprotein translocase subunit SecG